MDFDINAVMDAVRAGCMPVEVASTAGRKTFIVPGFGPNPTQTVEIDMEAGHPHPSRKSGKVTVFDAASFNQVLKDNADAGNIAIYMDRHPDHPKVVAVLNGNGTAGPGWGDFRAEIEFRPTAQWVKWKALDGKLMQQVPFSEFIEENMEDIAEPAGAVMLEIASYLTAVRTVNFRSGIKLQGGLVQLQHDEADDVKAGELKVPEEFHLGINPIFGLASYKVPCRFRYRIQDRKLFLGFKIQRAETLMQKIVEDVIKAIERGANISVLDGLPP